MDIAVDPVPTNVSVTPDDATLGVGETVTIEAGTYTAQELAEKAREQLKTHFFSSFRSHGQNLLVGDVFTEHFYTDFDVIAVTAG